MKETNVISENKGFTLIEVLVSMAIFTVGALSIIGLQLTAIERGAKVRRLQTASQLVQYPIEAFKGTDFWTFDDIYKFYTTTIVAPNSITYTTDSAPAYQSVNTVLQQVTRQWRAMFERPISIGSSGKADVYFQELDSSPRMVRGTLNIKITRSGTVNLYADVTARIWWCDGRSVDTNCSLQMPDTARPPRLRKKQHYVESRARFVNNL